VVDKSFDDFMSMLDYPALVVTTQADGVPAGCLVGFGSQVADQPPRFLVSLAKGSHTLQVAGRSQHLAVHVLAQRHRALAALFGGETGHRVNKFERCSWRAGPQGLPILDEAIAWFVGRTVDWADIGDHAIFLLEPVATWASESDEEPLYLSDIDDLDPGYEQPSRLFDGAPGHVTNRYGMKFTLGGI
jgi:flavin reductase (DIM6/NTAB) family NADH-FMN oxidoreductase RutF